MIFPDPPHCLQVCEMEKNPCCILTCPAPWQEGHAEGCVPGSAPDPLQLSQLCNVGILIFSVVPFTAFSKSILKENSRSEPRLDLLDLEKGSPPPKISPKISPKTSLNASVADLPLLKPEASTP